jgi:ABC-type amino acid transport substrate-binding protein
MKTKTRCVLAVLGTLVSAACAAPPPEDGKPSPASREAAASTAPAEEPLPPPAYESALPEDMRSLVDSSFTGDFDEMVKRRIVRVAVPFNRSFYFVDKGVQRGLSYEYLVLFEEQLNKKLNTGNLKVHVVPIPMPRDVLLPALAAGKVDLVIAQLTVTPERQKIVDFTNPTRANVSEVLVTAPGVPAVSTIEELSGKEVFARKTSSYYASLQ